MRPFLPKSLIFLILVLSLLGIYLPLSVRLVGAANAVPPPKVSCLEEEFRNPEFNSQRPYQASPCGDSEKAYFCNNDYTILEKVSTKWDPRRCDDSNYTCLPEKNPYIIGGESGKNYLITLSGAQIPILGNTQETLNSQNASEKLDDAQKMTEYLSWYLAGASQKAESGADSFAKLVNFSGPVKKLVPSVIQEFQRFATLHEAGVKEEYTVDPNEYAGDPNLIKIDPQTGRAEVRETSTHNQIVACTTKNILGIDNPWVGIEKPIPCYDGGGKKANGNVYRMLKWWEGKYTGLIESLKIIPGWDGSKRWGYAIPPFPWQFEKDIYYQKAYNEWRGKECLIDPIFKKLWCVDIKIPGVVELHSNVMADLYQYIPLGNPTDKNAKHLVSGVQAHGEGGTEAKVISYDPLEAGDEPVLFYPHTQSTLEIAKFLNKTQGPKGVKGQGEGVEPATCTFVNVRSNTGDDITFENSKPQTHLKVKHVKTEVSLIGCSNDGEIKRWFEDCGPRPGLVTEPKKCASYPICKGEVAIVIPTTPKIPNANLIWQQTVADTNSAFRRIFPKIEEGAPVSCIAEIPGTANVNYIAASDTNLVKVSTAGPNVYTGEGSIQGQLFFPHLGSIYEYFLKGIQTALRPRGFGEPITNGTGCSQAPACGELPKLPKASGSCSLGKISPRVGNIPQSLKDIIEAAAETYKVPPNLILGIMYGEGLFNPGRFNWTNENVRNWATCVPIPGCSTSGDDNFLGFFSSDWANVVPHIEADLKKLDPNRQKPSQCNLLDAIYGLAWNLHNSADGGMPFQCFGINLNASVPSSCSWNDNQYESAIKVHESGYTQMCLTKEGSCVTGGGTDAACPTGGDTCETINNRYSNPSHNGCVWDVAHGN